MKKKVLLITSALFLTSLGWSAVPTEKGCEEQKFKFPLPKVASVPFRIGEKLTYRIQYEFVKGGTATMEVLEGPLINCRPTYQFLSRAVSNGFVDTFFVVRDINASTADRESLLSFGYHQNLREGHFRVVRTTTFDYVAGTYNYEKQYKGKTTVKQGSLDAPMHDVLSAFFTARTLPLELGQVYQIIVFSDAGFYQLKIKVAPKFEDIRVPAGHFECIRLDPELKSDGIFKMKDGKMQMWLTNDERHMPVLIRSRVSVGSFDAELESFDTPQNDMVKEQVPTR